MNLANSMGVCGEVENILHCVSRGKDGAVRDRVNVSMQGSREHRSMSAQIVE